MEIKQEKQKIPGVAHIDIGGKFNLAIDVTDTDIELRLYPITDGEIWDAPFTTFNVDRSEIEALEEELRKPE